MRVTFKQLRAIDPVAGEAFLHRHPLNFAVHDDPDSYHEFYIDPRGPDWVTHLVAVDNTLAPARVLEWVPSEHEWMVPLTIEETVK